MTWEQVEAIVNSPVAVASLALYFIWLIGRGGWVPGKTHELAIDRERERASEWKDIALGVLPVAEKTVELAERRRTER